MAGFCYPAISSLSSKVRLWSSTSTRQLPAVLHRGLLTVSWRLYSLLLLIGYPSLLSAPVLGVWTTSSQSSLAPNAYWRLFKLVQTVNLPYQSLCKFFSKTSWQSYLLQLFLRLKSIQPGGERGNETSLFLASVNCCEIYAKASRGA